MKDIKPLVKRGRDDIDEVIDLLLSELQDIERGQGLNEVRRIVEFD